MSEERSLQPKVIGRADLPDFRGRALVLYLRGLPLDSPTVLTDAAFETQGGRLFLTGTCQPTEPSMDEWVTGVRCCVAWEAVEQYLVFGSLGEYYARLQQSDARTASAPAPVDPSGIPVTRDTHLEIGSPVLASWDGDWWRAEVVGLGPGDRVRIHFIGWDSSYDQTVPRSALQVDISESIEDEP